MRTATTASIVLVVLVSVMTACERNEASAPEPVVFPDFTVLEKYIGNDSPMLTVMFAGAERRLAVPAQCWNAARIGELLPEEVPNDRTVNTSAPTAVRGIICR